MSQVVMLIGMPQVLTRDVTRVQAQVAGAATVEVADPGQLAAAVRPATRAVPVEVAVELAVPAPVATGG